MRVRGIRRVLAMTAALLWATPVTAQVATAVVVQIRAGAGAGVDVRLEPLGTIGRAWKGRTDASGRVVFRRVAPGPYRLIFPAADSASAGRELTVRLGEVLTIEVDSTSSGSAVTRHEPVGNRISFAQPDLMLLPSSANLWSLIETAAPFTFSDRMDTGGISTGDPALVGRNASSFTQATFFQGGVNATSAFLGGTPLLYPDLDNLRAVSIVGAGASIEIGAPGPAIVLIPAAPSTLWHTSALLEATPARNRARGGGGPPSLQALRSWKHGNLVTGGPVGRRTGMTVSATSTRSTHLDRDQPPILPGDVDSINAGIVSTPADDRQLDVRVGVQRTVHPFAERARLQDRSATAHDGFVSLTGTWQRGSTSPLWIDAGVHSAHKTVDAVSAMNGAVEALRDGPVGQLAVSTPNARSRWSLDAGVAPSLSGFDRGRHVVTIGAVLSHASASTSLFGQDPIGEMVNAIPARAWVFTGSFTHPHETTAVIYANDRYAPARRITVDVGLRLETLRASSGAGTGRIAWINAAPRLSLRWAPFDRLSLFAASRRYNGELPLIDLAYGDPSAPQGSVYRWQDPNGDRLVEPSELGVLIARVGPGSAGGLSSIDPRLARPHVAEVVLGFDARLTRAWTLRMMGVATHERELIGLTDPGVASYDAFAVPDPGLDLLQAPDHQHLPVYARPPATFGLDKYLLTNPPGLNSAFNGLEMVLDGTVGRVHTLFGATATRSHGPAANRGFLPIENDQGLPGELLVDRNAATYADGRLFFERGYSIKWSNTYVGPRGIRGAIAARYEDGQNFARFVIVRNLPQGPEAIRAFANGRTKFTYTLTLDARVEKAFAFGRGQLAAIVEAYNLLNTANEVEENAVSGSAFRTATALQPPRVFRIGLRLAY